MRRPPVHLRNYHCIKVTFVIPPFLKAFFMAEMPVSIKKTVFRCCQCLRELKVAASERPPSGTDPPRVADPLL